MLSIYILTKYIVAIIMGPFSLSLLQRQMKASMGLQSFPSFSTYLLYFLIAP